ncbi:MAG TPA: four helix bundle protein [Anaerolineae bacterium]|nr:four helix bundle protein [Anaerolineae bacterium]
MERGIIDKIKSYRDLQIWQKAVELAVHVCQITEMFPKSEVYGLAGQVRRAAVSIPSNIAEGHSRSQAELSRFLSIARGSLAELETQMKIAQRIGYLSQKDHTVLFEETNTLGRQINVFHQRVDATLGR